MTLLRSVVAACLMLSAVSSARAEPEVAAPPAPPAPPTVPVPPSRWQSAEAPPRPADYGCTERLTDDPDLNRAIEALTFTTGEEARPLSAVTITGLETLAADELWRYLGGETEPPGPARAAVLVRRLVASGLFASVTPTVRLNGEGGPTLELAVVEFPVLRRVIFEGLVETSPTVLLDALLEVPPRERPRARTGRCPDAPPPRSWVARAEGEAVLPGIVWKGVGPALERVGRRLFDRGYLMASFTAALSPDGALTVRVDEGRLGTVTIEGVAPRIEPRVRQLLDLQPGQIFVVHDLGAALARVNRELPFLYQVGRDRPTREVPRVIELPPAEDGERRYRTAERPPSPGDGGPIGPAQPVGERLRRLRRRSGVVVEDRNLVLFFESKRFAGAVHASPELIRHTPVTGFAPGLESSAWLWDPQNRVHLALDLAGNVNTNAASGNDQRWRFDWLVGPRLAIPALRLVELGAHAYSRVDTFDRWRLSRLDSYLYSFFFNRPGADYFHRKGVTAFATSRPFDNLLVGVEYRRDRYHSLVSDEDVFTVFNRDERPAATPAITEGTMASLLFRLEWSTHPGAAVWMGNRLRDPERSLSASDGVLGEGGVWWTALRTVNTVEVAAPSLGGDDRFRYVRLVSDTAAFLRTHGARSGLKLRFRAAGKLDGRLPVQKQEALGGWSALRGYGFKELGPGNFSLLGTAEYRFGPLSAFLDAGSVRTAGSFGPARVGVGAALNLGDEVHLDLAWRTDDRAELAPEVRLLLQRTF